MFKLSGLFIFSYFSVSQGFHFPRLTHNEMDFFLMPLIGYLSILLLPWADHLWAAPLRKKLQKAR